MTREQLDAIRARVEAATPGPWEPSSDTLTWIHVEAHGLTVAECRTYLNRQHSNEQNDANAAFIAKAREDVPALLAEVERLTAERNAALEAARPRPSQPTPTNDAQTIYQVGYEDGQKQGMDRMQQAIIDMLSDADPGIIARIVAMEYP